MRLRTLIGGFVATAALVALCYRVVDRPVALAVAGWVLNGLPAGSRRFELPDLLLPFVVLVSVVGWSGRFLLAGDPARARLRNFLALLGVVAPASYLAKDGLKFVFGRVEAREWLMNPQLEGFHLFQGGGAYDGFPSGHMTVFVALAVVLWRHYPRRAPLYAIGVAALAAVLVLTDYHFVSDVIAGFYAGVLVYGLTTGRAATAFFRIPP